MSLARTRTVALTFAVAVAVVLASAGAAWANTLTVTTTADSVPGSLRATIAAANAGDTVAVPAGHYILSAGEIQITQPIAVAGAGANSSVIDAQGNSRVFEVLSGGGLALNGVQVTGGNTSSLPGGGGVLVDAGAGDLTLLNTVVTGNTVNVSMGTTPAGGGGGIYNDGSNTIVTTSSISGNTATVATTGSCCHGGAGLFSRAGAVTITNSHLDNNQVTVNGPATNDDSSSSPGNWYGDGGGALRQIAQEPTTITSSTLNGNSATITSGDGSHGGGAISVGTPESVNASLTIDSSTFSGNTATLSSSSTYNGGGAIQYHPDFDDTPVSVLKLTNSLINGNTATFTGTPTQSGGGGIVDANVGDSFVNSTITANTTNVPASTETGGGGLLIARTYNNAQNTLANLTVSGNSASYSSGGGILGVQSALVRVKNSIVARNSAATAANCSGSVVSSAYNLVDSSDSCGFAKTGDQVVSPSSIGLGSLANNGGPTMTEALQAGSPAIDAGNPNGCTDASGALLSADQRGFARPSGPRCDIGAFEFAEHTLTVKVVGGGTVTGSGISCPGTCSRVYPAGTSVTLTASPAAGSTAAKWSGACSGAGSCALTMNVDQTATATFGTASGTGGKAHAKCTLAVTRHYVKHSKKAKKTLRALLVKVTCNQAVKGTLRGKLVELLTKSKHHRTRTLSLHALVSSLRAHRAGVFSVKLPVPATTGPHAAKLKSAVFTLVVTNANGRATFIIRVRF